MLPRLFIQLAVPGDAVSGANVKIKDVVTSTLVFTANCNIFSEVRKLLQLIYLLLVTTTYAERSFPALRRLKTYLRTTVIAQRQKVRMCKIGSEFVSRNQKREGIFGKLCRVFCSFSVLWLQDSASL